jgi:parallel beta-helix repeat protein
MNRKEGIGIVAAGIMAAICAHAGELDPPSSPASTPGPEPRTAVNQDNTPGSSSAFFVITRPGSYYLTGNIRNQSLLSSRDGIRIAANDVTLDLNGFTLDGLELIGIPIAGSPQPQGLLAPTTGVRASGDLTNITVMNGVVLDWNDRGINLSSADACVVRDIRSRSNDGLGISVGDRSLIIDCLAESNAGGGIRGGESCQVIHSTASLNTGSGISVGPGSLVESCVARGNLGGGIGIDAGDNSRVVGCISESNGASGIRVQDRCIVTDCLSTLNGSSGISIGSRTVAAGNSCSENGGDGITVFPTTEGNCRVDVNTVTDNGDWGIFVFGSGGDCIFVRNMASDNTSGNYDFGSGDHSGQIISAPGNGFVASNPWANFSF